MAAKRSAKSKATGKAKKAPGKGKPASREKAATTAKKAARAKGEPAPRGPYKQRKAPAARKPKAPKAAPVDGTPEPEVKVPGWNEIVQEGAKITVRGPPAGYKAELLQLKGPLAEELGIADFSVVSMEQVSVTGEDVAPSAPENGTITTFKFESVEAARAAFDRGFSESDPEKAIFTCDSNTRWAADELADLGKTL